MIGNQPNSRLFLSNPNEVTEAALSDLITKINSSGIPFGLPGVVINSSDSLNQNRLQVRVPIIDDVYYFDNKGQRIANSTTGDNNLPWSLPSSSRFIETPENGALVFVIFMNSDSPYLGRIWTAAITDSVTGSNLFDPSRLTSEDNGIQAWKNLEKYAGFSYNFSPTNRNRSVIPARVKTTNYKVGIRGKDKNEVLLDQGKVTVAQNIGEDNETKLVLTDKASLTSQNIDILSTNSSSKQRPMFAQPNYQFLDGFLQLVSSTLDLLGSSPSINSLSGSPNLPNPAFDELVAQAAELKVQLEKLEQPGQGSSEYIQVN